MKEIIYFAYGSNLNIEEMNKRCPSSNILGSTILKDYKLVFKGSSQGKSYLTIEESPNSIVPIEIYQISSLDEKRLDIYEGYPNLYSKNEISLPFKNPNSKELQEIKGIIYIMNPLYSYNKPSYSYYLICQKGYLDFQFDLQYLEDALKESQSKKLNKNIFPL